MHTFISCCRNFAPSGIRFLKISSHVLLSVRIMKHNILPKAVIEQLAVPGTNPSGADSLTAVTWRFCVGSIWSKGK